MNEQNVKALFMAQYMFQKVYTRSDFTGGAQQALVTTLAGDIFDTGQEFFVQKGVLLLRSVSQLTDDEIISIGANIGWGISLESPNPNVKTMVLDNVKRDFCNPDVMRAKMKEHLKLLGVLTSFTYLNENKQPVTLQPEEIIAKGWAKTL